MPSREEKMEKIYKVVRIAIFAIPVLVVIVGMYLVLFPVDTYNFYPDNQKLSKFEITKDTEEKKLSFGVFPLRSYRYIELSMNFKKSEKANCQASNAEVTLQKTYQAFMAPTGETITDENRLRDIIFDSNKTKFPNGSLLHLNPTNEVFLVSRGQKILFPGPEIFQAFGYSFDNLVEVQKSDIDSFPDSDPKVFLWTLPHPDGTVFQAYPSHQLFIFFDGKKYPIANKELLDKVWPENYSIPVSDLTEENISKCKTSGSQNSISCRFDSAALSGLGRFYYFSVKFPENCDLVGVHPDNSRIRFFSERSTETVKSSFQTIAASVLNRYFFKQ
ncbi:MAG: hypothetical protein NT093_01670 [Candidatus Moranbacteria bacterium]|nr:hypothetical protein [Candidatus Moranbacteria bacterium]